MKALILVDIQNDFVPSGALAVNEGDQIIPIVNRLQEKFELIVATQDWHPAEHKSFAANHKGKKVGEIIDLYGLEQILWPTHCVQGGFGADFVSSFNMDRVSKIFTKGTDINIDSYSGFFDNGHRKSTGLGDYLKAQGVREVYIAGLATDYCVKFTAIDAQSLGFKTYIVEDACRGVNLHEGDVEKAISDMQTMGIHPIQSQEMDFFREKPRS